MEPGDRRAMSVIEQWTITSLPPAACEIKGEPQTVLPDGSKYVTWAHVLRIGPARLHHPLPASTDKDLPQCPLKPGILARTSPVAGPKFSSYLRPFWTAYGPDSATGLLPGSPSQEKPYRLIAVWPSERNRF